MLKKLFLNKNIQIFIRILNISNFNLILSLSYIKLHSPTLFFENFTVKKNSATGL